MAITSVITSSPPPWIAISPNVERNSLRSTTSGRASNSVSVAGPALRSMTRRVGVGGGYTTPIVPSTAGGYSRTVSAAERRLSKYDSMRDFTKSPEPPGQVAGSADGRNRFLVQRHRARRLHYDLRFEIDGVLVSWAVPRGPSLDPARKSLAVKVEDHPYAYGWFEGIIPSGYGKGDVVLWDDGWWEPDPEYPDEPPAADGDRARRVQVRARSGASCAAASCSSRTAQAGQPTTTSGC